MVHADVSPAYDKVILTPAWNETELLKLLPGCHYKERTWSMPLAYGNLVMLRGMFTAHLELSVDLQAWAWDVRRQRVDPSLGLRLATGFDDPDYDLGEPRLYPFQRAGVMFMETARNGLLGDELGVGKTVQALVYLRRLAQYPVLVVCPNSVKHHWARRVPEWVPGATPYVLEGGAVKIRRLLADAKQDQAAIVIINYEAVRSYSRLAPYGSIKLKRCQQCDKRHGEDIKATQCHVHPKELNGFGFKVTIIDEAHHIGDPGAQQTRAVWSVVHDPSVQYRWALTGTPDNIERLWSIMHAVAPSEYPVRSLWMDRYALRSWNAYGGLDVVGIRPDTRAELLQSLDPRFRRMIVDVVLPQMPPVVYEVRQSELTPTMRRQYDDLETKLHTRLDNGELFLTANKLVARTRQLQFAAGTVQVEKPDEDDVTTWRVKITDPSPKIDVLEEVLDELGEHEAFVVACLHRDVVDMAAERLGRRGIRHQVIVGGVHPAVAQTATDELKSGKIRAIVFTIDAGGEGLDMSGAGVMIRLQRTWSLIKSVQAQGRVRRIGSEVHQCIRVIDVITRNTREEYQMQRLAEKMEQFEEIARDRNQVQVKLTTTPVTSPEFTDLIMKLDALNQARDRLLNTDDLEETA